MESKVDKLKELHKDIERTKKALVKRWEKIGAVENFGEKESRSLRDRWGIYEGHVGEALVVRDELQGFDKWRWTFTGVKVQGRVK
jgi:hypothetical protein